jgi:hydrogenase expression/formation protein HypD
MRYVDEFRDKKKILGLSKRIRAFSFKERINIMEVCGSHTQGFHRFGLGGLLPQNLRLISGPGCPVCVSPTSYIDTAIALGQDRNAIILTFGDMLRIPGTSSTLEEARGLNGNVQVVYSAWDSLRIAGQNPSKKIVFLAVGFETTAPTVALSILAAKKKKINNLFFLCSLKLIPPAMKYLLQDQRVKIDGFLCPGHVSAIIGTTHYEFIPKRYKIGCAVAGFEPLDILEGICLLLRQIKGRCPKVENQYLRVVTKRGNIKAQGIIKSVFSKEDSYWRALGSIPQSGLKIKRELSRFDAQEEFGIKQKAATDKAVTRCRCSDVLKGLISPLGCPVFKKDCLPEHPIGPCMVSREGACNVYYRYH